MRVPAGVRFMIGRAADADLRLEDPTVSRVHAFIDTTEPTPVLIDAGGANVARIGRKRARRPTALRAGSTIRLGKATVEVVSVHSGIAAQPVAQPSSRTEMLRQALQRSQRQSHVVLVVSLVVVVAVGAVVANRVRSSPASSSREVADAASRGVVRIGRSVDGAEVGQGTGFSIGGGLVLTAAHVIREGGELTVSDDEGRRAVATLRSAAVCDDLALIEVSDLPLRALALGRQGDLSRGDAVIAIGFPASVTGGLDLTVTSGVVSVVESSIAIDGLGIPRLPNVLQTDAAVNPGNSGGPLVTTEGRVVGVLSLVVNRLSSGEVSGQAYAVGVDRVRKLLDPLRNGTPPGWHGALISGSTGRLLVTAVVPGSPAQVAGVGVGDEATELGGVPLPGDFEAFCRGLAVAPSASLTFQTRSGSVEVP